MFSSPMRSSLTLPALPSSSVVKSLSCVTMLAPVARASASMSLFLTRRVVSMPFLAR